MTCHLRIASGGQARVVQTDGVAVVLLADVPVPAGATLELRLSDDPRPLWVKVRGARRTSAESADYRIEGRFVNLGKALRERLTVAASGAGPGRR